MTIVKRPYTAWDARRRQTLSPRKRLGFENRFLSAMKLLWRPNDGLRPSVGADIGLSRASASSGRHHGSIHPAPTNDQLPIDHSIYSAATVYPGYRSEPWNWSGGNVTATHDGPAGALNQSMAKAIGSGTDTVYHYLGKGFSPTVGDDLVLVYYISRYNTSSRYVGVGFGAWSNSSSRQILFDFDNPTSPASYRNLTAADVDITAMENNVWKITIRTTAFLTGYTNLRFHIADPSGNTSYDADTYPDQGVYVDCAYGFISTIEFPLAYPSPEDANAYAAAASQINVDLGEVISGTLLELSVARWNHARTAMTSDEYVSVLGISSATAPRMAVFRESSASKLSAWHVDASALLYSIDLTDSDVMSDIDDGEYIAICAQFGTDGLRLSAQSETGHYATAIDASGDASLPAAYACNTYKLGHYHNAALNGNVILPFASLLNPAGDYSPEDIRRLMNQALDQAREVYA